MLPRSPCFQTPLTIQRGGRSRKPPVFWQSALPCFTYFNSILWKSCKSFLLFFLFFCLQLAWLYNCSVHVTCMHRKWCLKGRELKAFLFLSFLSFRGVPIQAVKWYQNTACFLLSTFVSFLLHFICGLQLLRGVLWQGRARESGCYEFEHHSQLDSLCLLQRLPTLQMEWAEGTPWSHLLQLMARPWLRQFLTEQLRPVTLPVATFANRQKGHGACPLFKTRIIIPDALGELGEQHLH